MTVSDRIPGGDPVAGRPKREVWVERIVAHVAEVADSESAGARDTGRLGLLRRMAGSAPNLLARGSCPLVAGLHDLTHSDLAHVAEELDYLLNQPPTRSSNGRLATCWTSWASAGRSDPPIPTFTLVPTAGSACSSRRSRPGIQTSRTGPSRRTGRGWNSCPPKGAAWRTAWPAEHPEFYAAVDRDAE
ncbi:hypothetical protein [Flindersiella endophytica]